MTAHFASQQIAFNPAWILQVSEKCNQPRVVQEFSWVYLIVCIWIFLSFFHIQSFHNILLLRFLQCEINVLLQNVFPHAKCWKGLSGVQQANHILGTISTLRAFVWLLSYGYSLYSLLGTLSHNLDSLKASLRVQVLWCGIRSSFPPIFPYIPDIHKVLLFFLQSRMGLQIFLQSYVFSHIAHW